MLTAVYFTLILLGLLVVLAGFGDAARHIFSFLSPRRGAPPPPPPHILSKTLA